MGNAQPIDGHLFEPEIFEIRIQGHLHQRWSALFEGVTVTQERDGTTTICGLLPDQTALHGILLKIRNMNLRLISVNKIESAIPDPSTDIESPASTEEFVATFPWFVEEAFGKRNMGAWDELFHPVYKEHDQSSGIIKDLTACKKNFEHVQSSFSDPRIKIEEIIAHRESVVVRMILEDVGAVEIKERLHGSRIQKQYVCSVYHLKDGKAFEGFIYGKWSGPFTRTELMPTIGEEEG